MNVEHYLFQCCTLTAQSNGRETWGWLLLTSQCVQERAVPLPSQLPLRPLLVGRGQQARAKPPGRQGKAPQEGSGKVSTVWKSMRPARVPPQYLWISPCRAMAWRPGSPHIMAGAAEDCQELRVMRWKKCSHSFEDHTASSMPLSWGFLGCPTNIARRMVSVLFYKHHPKIQYSPLLLKTEFFKKKFSSQERLLWSH